jgi:PAS domain S-box-containing protein
LKATTKANTYPFLSGGGELGELTRQYDWQATPLGTPDKWPQSLRATLSIILHAKAPMFLWWGPKLIQFYNDAYRLSLGDNGKHPTALGQEGAACWTEIWPIIKPLIDQVMNGGEATWSQNQLIPIHRNGGLENVYWTFNYSPVYDDTGAISGVFVTFSETTKAVLGRQKAEESQQQVLASFAELSVAIAIISKDKLTFQLANPFFGHLVGRAPEEIMGKPLLEALPELIGQGFDQLLNQVIETGEPFIANEVAVELVRQERLQTIYVDMIYQPRREVDNHISGVLVMATDVTRQVFDRRKVEENEGRFRSLVEESPVATCLFVGPELVIEVANELMIRFFGCGPSIVGQSVRSVLTDSAGQAAIVLLEQVFSSGKPFAALGAPAYLTIDGVEDIYYFDFSLKPLRDAAGMVYGVLETAVDVTDQVLDRQQLTESEARYKALTAELDGLVQQRTEQLQASVYDLQRSNENLQQFAYIASHDLQEPLRKIQSFGDLLRTQYADALGDGSPYLERMQSAASRMSMLIKDLLNYSRIATTQDITAPVALSDVLDRVLSDLDLVISETSAQVSVDPLPTVVGDGSQLGQLFGNLLSNALKFRKPNQVPVIQVNVHFVSATELPPSNTPTRLSSSYHRIDVVDNGIGFDETYVDRIFQVFQRLHGKNKYAGTGIGLAICQKVVANHGGVITARSQPGQGAIFSVYLPV